MKLSSEEYRRGIVKWNPSASIEVRTSATNDLSAPPVWSDPLVEPNGSQVLSSPGQFVEMSFRRTGAGDLPFPARWDRLASAGAVQAIVFDPEHNGGGYIQLAHIPNYGIFHRLVIEATQTLKWEADVVLRVGDVVVRLVTGKVVGERISPLDEVQVHAEGFSLTSDKIGTVKLDGRFIEIVAPGQTETEAELNASSTLGLLALVFGSSVVGHVVFTEPYNAAPGEPQRGEYRIPVTRNLPAEIENDGLDAVDRILSGLLADEPMSRALRLSLHWFERGIRSQTPLDELICYFVGIETILNTFASIHGPIPAIEERKSAVSPKIKALLAGEVDKDVIGRLLNSVGYASANDRLAFFVDRRGFTHSVVSRFRELLDARNRAFHGEPAGVTPEIAAMAKSLLVAMLKQELEIDLALPWEVNSQVLDFRFGWSFADYGFHGTK